MARLIADVADRLAKQYIVPYTDRLRRSKIIPTSPKEINDPVWGTIALTPLEVAIVDSPLLQRLRHLRQLGVAHWLYPGAGHSRFEHSLGVLQQTEQLITAINRASASRYTETIITPDLRDILRLAALLHDVGHPVLSHVSEYALTLDPPALLELQRHKKANGEGVKLSEFIAAALVQSNEFKDLLEVIFATHSDKNLPTKVWAHRADVLLKDVANCILAKQVSDKVPLLHQIISGPFDADKLDYMIRDAKAAGIPSIIDISRLLQKLTVRRLPQEQLPPLVAKNVRGELPGYYLFGFSWSGLSVVDELLLARMILYSKVYRHPKVSAVEAMVQATVNQLAILTSPAKVVDFVYSVLDDELILAGSADLLRHLKLEEKDVSDDIKRQALSVATGMLTRLRERNLFVRGFVFHSHDQKNNTDNDDSNPFSRIISILKDAARRESLRKAIVVEVKTIMELLHEECGSDRCYLELNESILIHKVEAPSQEELRHALIFPSSGVPKTYKDTKINKEAWSSSFSSGTAKGFIFCPREIEQYVFIAAEVAIFNVIGVGVPDWMMEEAKQSVEDIRKIKLSLRDKGYYSGKPVAIWPRSDALLSAFAGNVINEFAQRFAAVQETVSASLDVDQKAETGFEVMRNRAYAWLEQFETAEFIGCGLSLLTKARLLGRSDTISAIRRFIQDNPEFLDASVVPVSKGAESGQIIHYYAGDIGGDLKFFLSLKDAVESGRDKPILFVDDFCGSGGQMTDVLSKWFHRPDVGRPDLHEQRELALEAEKDFLTSRKLGIVFVAGWNEGVTSVEAVAKKIGANLKVYAHITDEKIPFAFEDVDTSIPQEVWERFKKKCSEIGVGLLKSEESWTEDKRQARALGYGNKGMLLFFPYNSPSQTLTCMWAEGSLDGRPWAFIMRRRKKV